MIHKNNSEWLKTDHPREVAEAALEHKVRNQIEAAYRRSDLFERRRILMDDWAGYLAQGSRAPDRSVDSPKPPISRPQ